jgi:hypothetical protein
MAVTPSHVELHIEEFVLHDVEPSARHAVAAALQRELEALIAREGIASLLARPEAFARWSPDPVSLAPDARPDAMGRQVARALHQGWK